MANGEVRCIDGELPFEIPCNWEWCRLGSVIHLLSGRDLEPNQYSNIPSGIPYMTGASNFENGELIINRWTNNPVTISSKGDLLITCKGTIGTMAFNNIGDIHIARQIMSISSIKHEIKFIQFFLDWYVSILQKKAKSIIPGISRENLLEAIVPTPPLKEQRRIVSKLEELLLHIDKYDAAQTQLDRLNDELYGLLKKSILQEAIHGKLVPQCDTDEPASKLLERIKDEKQKLVKAGKLKAKDIVDSVIFKGEDNKYYEKCGEDLTCIDKEIPFEIPTSWLWCRLQSLVAILDGYRKPISKEARKHGEYPYYGANGILDYVNDYIFDGEYLLVGEDGSVVSPNGNPIVNKVSGKIWVNNHAHVLQEYGKLGYYEYLFYALSTIKITQYIHGFMPKYSQGDLRKTLIPVPPLAEQQRILLKIAQALASIMSR